MYNKILKGLYRDFKAKRNDVNETIDFLNCNGDIVASLYPSTQVLNIFLKAARDVVWNHHGYAIFVLAKHWTMLNKSHLHKAEAAWLIGMCGRASGNNLEHPMFLDNSSYTIPSDYHRLIGYAPLSDIVANKNGNGVNFKILEYEITYCFAPDSDSYIDYLNPALIYPVKTRGIRDYEKQCVKYLRNKYDWQYNAGFETAGSKETREFISKVAPFNNHDKLSKISYYRVFEK